MVVTREEALKRVDELAQKVDVLKKGSDALEKRALDLAKANEELKHQAGVEYDRAERLLKERDRLQYQLDGYRDLAKALSKIRGETVSPELVRQIVREELPKVVGSNPAPVEGVQVTESVPYLDLKVSKPWLTLDESTVEGQVTVMALRGILPEGFGFGAVMKSLEKEYSTHPRRQTVDKALDALVGKYKALERRTEGNQWVYSLRRDARSRVKESETRDAVEAAE
jgi:phage-related minor tail protein